MTSPTISLTPWHSEKGVSPIRLTSRGRALLTALLATAVVLAGMAVLLGAVSGSRDTAAETFVVVDRASLSGGAALAAQGLAIAHVVVRGDTLWELATAVDPAADPRPTVDLIRRWNGLDSSDLAIGQQLWIPVAGAREG